MISTTYDSQAIYLLNFSPDWNVRKFRADVAIVATPLPDTGLSKREGRRPFAASLRFVSTYSITVHGTDARQLAGALRDYQTQPVVIPLWPAMVNWADRASMPISGGLKVAWTTDWAQWEIYESVEPSGFTPEFVAPALWGRLQKPDWKWASGDTITLDVEHYEASKYAWAITPASASFTDGPLPGVAYTTAPKLADFPVAFDGINERYGVTVIRQQIGLGREDGETLYPQTNTRESEPGYVLRTLSEAGRMLRFFYEHGAGKSFWAPSWTAAVDLTANVGALDTTINVVDTHLIRQYDRLLFIGDPEATPVAVQATTVNPTSLVLNAAPGVFTVGTLICQMFLAKLDRPQLTIEWSSFEVARCRLSVVELPPEYEPAEDETLGETIGLLTQRGYLYEFSEVLQDATFTYRYTSHERDVTLGPYTYSTTKIEHGAIQQGIALDRDEVTIDWHLFTGHPWLAQATLKSESRMTVKIYEADVVNGVASNQAVIFTGTVEPISVSGKLFSATCVPGGTIFERKIPTFKVQLGCNHCLFSEGCGLFKGNWRFNAKVSNPGSAGYPFTFELSELARIIGPTPTFFEDWFAGGWIEFGTGANWQRRSILKSTNPSGGVLTVTLPRDPYPYPTVNDTVILYPGCDGRAETCKAYDATINPQGKFDNWVNFGGHFALPVSNPSLLKVSPQAAGGGKK